MAKQLSVITGPNLNLLGTRETDIYGTETLERIVERASVKAGSLGYSIIAFQSNIEGAIIDAIQASRTTCAGILINGGGYSHTSVAIRDALSAVALPAIEVHFTNVYAREPFRHQSYLSAIVNGVICGFGPQSYELAVLALVGILEDKAA